MAIISEIRKRPKIVLFVIAIAVAGFVLMDMTSGGDGRTTDTTVAKVAGKKIDYQTDLLRMEQALYSGSSTDMYSRRQYVYNLLVESAILEKEAKLLGIGVSDSELEELQYGTRKSTIVAQRFTDPNTGMMDEQQLSSIKQQIADGSATPELALFWQAQKKEIIKDRIQTKLSTLIQKGMYAPSWVTKYEFSKNNDRYNIEYIGVPFDAIPDEEVEVSDKAINDYLSENKEKYKFFGERRRLDFIIFDVKATPEDSANIRRELENLIEPFTETQNDTVFVDTNIGLFDRAYDMKEDLPEDIRDIIFNMPIGSVYGPYEEEGTYRIAKLVDKKIIPDSVKSRHILLRVTTNEEAMAAQQRLDSIKTAIENKETTFEEMAMKFSSDGSAQSGGDLGWAGQGTMVPEFNDYIFYEGEPGKLGFVYTQFGLHLVEVTDKKFLKRESGVQLAIITREITPSEDVQNQIFDRAFDLVNTHRDLESLKNAVADIEDLRVQTSQEIAENDFSIPSISNNPDCREMIRWAFGKKRNVNEVSGDVYAINAPDSYYTEKFVVVGLNSITPKGVPDAKVMRTHLEDIVRNELKAKIIIENITDKSPEEIKSIYPTANSGVAEEVTFASGELGEVGVEPVVAAAAMGMEMNVYTRPVKGNGGVFIAKVINMSPGVMTDESFFKNNAQTNFRRQFESRFMNSLVEQYDIKDQRFKFY